MSGGGVKGDQLMRNLNFTEAIDDALAQIMADDQRIIVLGEDIPLLRRGLLVKFGNKAVFEHLSHIRRFCSHDYNDLMCLALIGVVFPDVCHSRGSTR